MALNSSLNATEVTFMVRAELGRGEKVALSGSVTELGEWSAKESVVLHTDAESFPVWTTTIALTGTSPIQYKYLVLSEGPPRWEESPEVNRALVAVGSKMLLDDGEFISDAGVAAERLALPVGSGRASSHRFVTASRTPPSGKRGLDAPDSVTAENLRLKAELAELKAKFALISENGAQSTLQDTPALSRRDQILHKYRLSPDQRRPQQRPQSATVRSTPELPTPTVRPQSATTRTGTRPVFPDTLPEPKPAGLATATRGPPQLSLIDNSGVPVRPQSAFSKSRGLYASSPKARQRPQSALVRPSADTASGAPVLGCRALRPQSAPRRIVIPQPSNIRDRLMQRPELAPVSRPASAVGDQPQQQQHLSARWWTRFPRRALTPDGQWLRPQTAGSRYTLRKLSELPAGARPRTAGVARDLNARAASAEANRPHTAPPVRPGTVVTKYLLAERPGSGSRSRRPGAGALGAHGAVVDFGIDEDVGDDEIVLLHSGPGMGPLAAVEESPDGDTATEGKQSVRGDPPSAELFLPPLDPPPAQTAGETEAQSHRLYIDIDPNNPSPRRALAADNAARAKGLKPAYDADPTPAPTWQVVDVVAVLSPGTPAPDPSRNIVVRPPSSPVIVPPSAVDPPQAKPTAGHTHAAGDKGDKRAVEPTPAAGKTAGDKGQTAGGKGDKREPTQTAGKTTAAGDKRADGKHTVVGQSAATSTPAADKDTGGKRTGAERTAGQHDAVRGGGDGGDGGDGGVKEPAPAQPDESPGAEVPVARESPEVSVAGDTEEPVPPQDSNRTPRFEPAGGSDGGERQSLQGDDHLHRVAKGSGAVEGSPQATTASPRLMFTDNESMTVSEIDRFDSDIECLPLDRDWHERNMVKLSMADPPRIRQQDGRVLQDGDSDICSVKRR